jgi:hypothetical protein
MNSHAQAGEVSVTAHTRVESEDGRKVKLLTGTSHGQPGEIVVLSTQVALREIELGRAVAV